MNRDTSQVKTDEPTSPRAWTMTFACCLSLLCCSWTVAQHGELRLVYFRVVRSPYPPFLPVRRHSPFALHKLGIVSSAGGLFGLVIQERLQDAQMPSYAEKRIDISGTGA